MAVFDESKVINALHKDKAEVGKKYWFADHISFLKTIVEKGNTNENLYELTGIDEISCLCFESSNESEWELLYPYEEPPKQRMTNRMIAEWCAKGNGEMTKNTYTHTYVYHDYHKSDENKDVDEDMLIRVWGSDDWVEPTVDIYERDCKGGKE